MSSLTSAPVAQVLEQLFANASRSEGYLTHVRSSGAYVSTGFENDVEISLRNRADS